MATKRQKTERKKQSPVKKNKEREKGESFVHLLHEVDWKLKVVVALRSE